jgi:hypothetical protein
MPRVLPAVFLLAGLASLLPRPGAAGPVERAGTAGALGAALPSPLALREGTSADPVALLLQGDAGDEATLAPAGDEALHGKSRRRALLLSLLVPGLGHHYAGYGGRAKFFFGVEAGVWTTYSVFRIQGHLRREDYIEYAQVYAGVRAADETDEYWRLVAAFPRSDPGPSSYNEQVRIEARFLFPGDRAAQDAYVLDHGYFGDRAWSWDSREQQLRYREIRSSSLDAYDRAKYTIAAAVLNRLVSAVDAVRLIARDAKRSEGGDGLGLRFEGGEELVARVTWTRAF